MTYSGMMYSELLNDGIYLFCPQQGDKALRATPHNHMSTFTVNNIYFRVVWHADLRERLPCPNQQVAPIRNPGGHKGQLGAARGY